LPCVNVTSSRNPPALSWWRLRDPRGEETPEIDRSLPQKPVVLAPRESITRVTVFRRSKLRRLWQGKTGTDRDVSL